MFKQLLLLFTLIAVSHASTAALSIPKRAAAFFDGTLAVDNDLFAFRGNDRDYTGGIRFTSTETDGRSWQFGLLLHTPDDIDADMYQRGERPYASLLYLGRTRTFIQSEAKLLKRTATIGLMGSQLGEAAQRFVHRQTDSPEPRGYDDQISDGGELTARLGFSQYRKLFKTRTRIGAITVVDELSGSIGYVTDASYGIGFRLEPGFENWWGNASHDFLPHLDEPASTDKLHGVFGGFRIRALGYDAMLQGQFRHSEVTFASDDLNRFVGEAWLGAATVIRGWQIRYTLRASQPQIKRGRASRSQLWGTLVFRREF